LRWQPVRELAEDEYYQVVVDYNYGEGNPQAVFTTRETQLTLPESLYHEPNCGVFNWQVTLMGQAATDEDAALAGEPISRPSLYWYVEWRYPSDAPAPFPAKCPNAQF
jgi:hypothetical protein